ncbi:MAG TPA: Rho termination factor N-terminal domain-containing protein [Solirubrobacteraceae bacterium]|jgi:transcription termination factor Rho|nr:Rho termination factor N-terminal domain-containing protein [Solirubrobacteraceae bacterium]
MTVLDRSELQASPLADLHLIADQIGLEGFRRLRKADLIDAILGEKGKQGAGEDENSSSDTDEGASDSTERRSSSRRSRSTRSRRASSATDEDEQKTQPTSETSETSERAPAARRGRGRPARERSDEPEQTAEGVVEVLGNGSAFLRVDPPEPSEKDVYISAAQVRRCELVSGDQVSGPVRTPRRSERYSSLVRIDTINGDPADSVAEGTRYDDLPVSYAGERLAFDSEDSTLKAIEWLTPLGRGSRAVIAGGSRSGKTETLRGILGALQGREGLELTLVLCGVRPEELGEWKQGQPAPAAALTFAASADAQGQAVETAIETAKRIAARGGDAIVLIDSLDGLHPHSARKALAAARNLTDGGSLTVIATASQPFGGETTVIALDAVRASTGQLPALDLVRSGTLKPELLVGEEGAEAITRARAAAAEG